MRYFIAYRYTGEDPAVVEERVARVAAALRKAGHEVWHNASEGERYREANMTARQIMDEGFKALDASDAVLVFITGNDRSEGQLMEVGYAYAKHKAIVVAVQQDVETYVDAMGTTVIHWSDLEDLEQQLAELP